jgi:hypothetical protein
MEMPPLAAVTPVVLLSRRSRQMVSAIEPAVSKHAIVRASQNLRPLILADDFLFGGMSAPTRGP